MTDPDKPGSRPEHEIPLAIIIPAYKPDYLARTLESLVRQTDRRFRLYVFDDASPADIGAIAREALGGYPHVFKRFEDNLGGQSLVRHWSRCIELTDEPWVWLFADDDLMDAECVAAFYRFLESDGDADVVRFDARIIGEDDRVIGLHPLHLERETWLEYAYGRLMGWRLTIMQQMIFRREACQRAGGFQDLPLGWHTDDAAVIALARIRPVRHLAGARMYWRRSEHNITPDDSPAMRRAKMLASCLFARWLHGLLQGPRETLFEHDGAVFASIMDRFLVDRIVTEGALPALANWSLLARTRREVCGAHPLGLLKFICYAGISGIVSGFGDWLKRVAGRAS
jgi:hypothetical protein